MMGKHKGRNEVLEEKACMSAMSWMFVCRERQIGREKNHPVSLRVLAHKLFAFFLSSPPSLSFSLTPRPPLPSALAVKQTSPERR